jgi:hypothetical protein
VTLSAESIHTRKSALECPCRAALPNPSLKLSPNGMAPGPRGALAYHAPHGPGTMPSVPA